MKIIRDGIEIELTNEELYNAWFEKEHDYACEELRIDIRERLDEVVADDVLDGMVESAYYIYGKSIGYGCDEDWAIDDAASEVVGQWLMNNENTISSEGNV